ncbi:MAG TPA: DUF6265 family protein [Longimicrobiaceae bacterium]
MKTILSASATALALACLAGAPLPPESQSTPSVSDLAWMAGCWERRGGETVVEEHWMRPAGGMMLGMSRTLRSARATDYETMRIEEREGAVVFIASPARQPTAEFRATATSRESVVFRNPAHDFPTSVGYRTAADGDSLLAWIEGPRGESTARIDFPMRRVAC